MKKLSIILIAIIIGLIVSIVLRTPSHININDEVYQKQIDSVTHILDSAKIVIAEREHKITQTEVKLDSVSKIKRTAKGSIVTVTEYLKDTVFVNASDNSITIDSNQVKDVAKCFDEREVLVELVEDYRLKDSISDFLREIQDTKLSIQDKQLYNLKENLLPLEFKKGKKKGFLNGVKMSFGVVTSVAIIALIRR
tara:strand:+ start:1622 stop:2206 length:585 start_codon:yes stop_codon:yes gene_type:complete